jgi:hypothetical protein
VFSVFTSRIVATDFNTVIIPIPLNSTLQISKYLFTGWLKSRLNSSPSLLGHLWMPSQETPSIIISQLAWDPRYIASHQPQQKTPLSNNSSIVIEACLLHHCIETAVLLLCACSFHRNLFTEPLPSKEPFCLSGIMSQYISVPKRYCFHTLTSQCKLRWTLQHKDRRCYNMVSGQGCHTPQGMMIDECEQWWNDD